eukprot:CAMPEP_0180561554 /NCGR_PEP_ID=MMETSP1037_2-20121125/3444_1 /TAXON_ID=632150 /ORGANISM="Azadinium spinosum, Strain 3D9" /LENGTH=337 /DNA_ID=CAMNT_0022578205 /DNA_START=91 /DNA_END=1104 /DNA_ORIENTATION=-
MSTVSVLIMLALGVAIPQASGLEMKPVQTSLQMRSITSLSTNAKAFEAFKVLADAAYRLEQKVDMGSIANSLQFIAMKLRARPFIVITRQRSGSALLMHKLDSHPQIAAFDEYFLHHRDDLETAFAYFLSSLGNKTSLKFIGFKLMVNQIDKVEDLFNSTLQPAPLFVMHWRRNDLRRLISSDANNHNASSSKNHIAHPKTDEAAEELAKFKPTMDASALKDMIAKDMNEQRKAAKMIKQSGSPTCPDSFLEDWISDETRASQLLFDCFQLAPLKLSTDLKPIHALTPILDTVANPDDVRKSLLHTEYAYMLEEGESQEAILEGLKVGDALLRHEQI